MRSKKSSLAVVAIILGCACLSAGAQATRADAEKDPLLKAMLEELDRSKSELQLHGQQKPYFIEYRIEEIEAFHTRGDFGASLGSSTMHHRAARVTVHVGDYKSDSSGQGDSVGAIEVLGDDPIALRSALWMATDQAYKGALDAYARKQAQLKQVQTPPQADDLSHEKPVIVLEAPQRLRVESAPWEKLMAQASGIFLNEPGLKESRAEVQYSSASFNAVAETIYVVNSEGTITRTAQSHFEESYRAGGQAADGMNLDRSYALAGNTVADLDAAPEFLHHAEECITGLSALRTAPLVEEEYHGPLLIEADAAAGTLKGLLARAFTASRPTLGTEARTTGPFATSYHSRVLPEFVDVVDDPSLSTWNGKGLVGAYTVDAEGVPAQAVQLVKAGKLENYLIGREPVKDFPQSNGHGRAGSYGGTQPSIGVLKIWSKDGLSEAELQQKLLEMAKDHTLASVYEVDAMTGGMTPRLLFKVSADGKRTLVRGAVLEDLDLRTLRSGVVAAGKELFANNQLGNVGETVLAPSLLFDDITIRRANRKNEKLPFYPPPQ